jgi:hypothetical protein
VLTALGPADLVAASLAFHLEAGVDLVVVPEGIVPDGIPGADVRAVLDPYVAAGTVRPATSALPTDGWLLTGSAHELWWPRASSLEAVLTAVPPGVAAVDALVRRLVPAPDDGRPLLERTVARVAAPAFPGDGLSVDERRRTVRRLGVAEPGDADARRAPRGWCPIEVLSVAPDGVSETTRLVQDTRLRDAVRAIGAGARPDFHRPTIDEDADFGVEVASLLEAEVVASRQRIDDLERRLVEREQARPAARLRAAARRAARAVGRRGDP